MKERASEVRGKFRKRVKENDKIVTNGLMFLGLNYLSRSTILYILV